MATIKLDGLTTKQANAIAMWFESEGFIEAFNSSKEAGILVSTGDPLLEQPEIDFDMVEFSPDHIISF